MNNTQANYINNGLLESTIMLLQKLNTDDQYYCIAGIPGPTLEMRSGTLPKGCICPKEFRDELIERLGLNRQVLQEYLKEMDKKYDFYALIKSIETLIPEDMQQPFFEDFIVAIERKIQGSSIWHNNATAIRKLTFKVNQKDVLISYPNDLVTIGLIMEIFLEDTYDLKKDILEVDEIYDLGANIGLSSIFFSTINPACHIKCVEPFAPNAAHLKDNIAHNGINAEIIPMAVSNQEHSHVKFYYSDQSHALPSLSTVQNCMCEVETTTLKKIVNGSNYGLKIDIEGSEAFLADNEEELANARFIVGELHYSNNHERNKKVDRFFSIVQNNFDIVMSRPVLYFVGDEVELCICYKATKNRQ